MSLRHALLGLLHAEPASGYDLTRQFETTLERIAWHARHSQIYPELNKMLAEGLVEVIEEGPRGRRTYAITDAGRADLRKWMMNPPADPQVRSEPLLRMFLMSTLDPVDARPLLQAHADEAAAGASQLREIIADFDAGNLPPGTAPTGRLLAEIGLRQQVASYDWALWAISELDQLAVSPKLSSGNTS
jgi:PadR family transcriptional regulator AphA